MSVEGTYHSRSGNVDSQYSSYQWRYITSYSGHVGGHTVRGFAYLFFFDISGDTDRNWASRSPFIVGSWGENTDIFFWRTGVSHGGTSRWSLGFANICIFFLILVFGCYLVRAMRIWVVWHGLSVLRVTARMSTLRYTIL